MARMTCSGLRCLRWHSFFLFQLRARHRCPWRGGSSGRDSTASTISWIGRSSIPHGGAWAPGAIGNETAFLRAVKLVSASLMVVAGVNLGRPRRRWDFSCGWVTDSAGASVGRSLVLLELGDPPGPASAGELDIHHDRGVGAVPAGSDRGDGELVLPVRGGRGVGRAIVPKGPEGDGGSAWCAAQVSHVAPGAAGGSPRTRAGSGGPSASAPRGPGRSSTATPLPATAPTPAPADQHSTAAPPSPTPAPDPPGIRCTDGLSSPQLCIKEVSGGGGPVGCGVAR